MLGVVGKVIARYSAAWLLLVLAVPGQAATRYVNGAGGDNNDNVCLDPGNPCRTIDYAVNVAVAGDIVDIADGVYTERIWISKSLTLQGTGDGAVVMQAHAAPGQAANRVITVDPFPGSPSIEVSIAGITIRHGVASGPGDAGTGGGLLVQGAALALTDVTFLANKAGFGGGMRMSTGSSATFDDVRFIGNRATDGCGGLHAQAGPATLTNVIFSENTAGQLLLDETGARDGPAAIPDGVADLSGGDFASGGGMCATASAVPLELTSVVFSNNAAGEDGGGMVIDGAAMLTDVTFANNIAHRNGGGLYSTGYHTLSGLNFTNNHAGERGGGMWHFGKGFLRMTDITFQGNSASDGGGLHFRNVSSSATLSGVMFFDNHAGGGYGGGMSNVLSSPVVTNAVFSGNQSDYGGGVYNRDAAPTFVHAVFGDNHGEDGGGMSNFGSSPTITNARFWHNTATFGGGGVANYAGSSLVLVNVSMYANHADSGGGGIDNYGSSSVFLVNATLSGNSANSTGGIYNGENSGLLLHNTIIWGNSTNIGANEIQNSGNSSAALHHCLYRNGPGDIDEGGGFMTHLSLTDDPLFVDAASGNLRLMAASPAIDTGDQDTDPLLFPVDTNGSPIDLDGLVRFFNGTIDMGACEWQLRPDRVFRDRFQAE